MHKLSSTQDVARELGVNRATVSRMVARGDLEAAVKAPGRTGAHLFDPREVERLKRWLIESRGMPR